MDESDRDSWICVREVRPVGSTAEKRATSWCTCDCCGRLIDAVILKIVGQRKELLHVAQTKRSKAMHDFIHDREHWVKADTELAVTRTFIYQSDAQHMACDGKSPVVGLGKEGEQRS